MFNDLLHCIAGGLYHYFVAPKSTSIRLSFYATCVQCVRVQIKCITRLYTLQTTVNRLNVTHAIYMKLSKRILVWLTPGELFNKKWCFVHKNKIQRTCSKKRRNHPHCKTLKNQFQYREIIYILGSYISLQP